MSAEPCHCTENLGRNCIWPHCRQDTVNAYPPQRLTPELSAAAERANSDLHHMPGEDAGKRLETQPIGHP